MKFKKSFRKFLLMLLVVLPLIIFFLTTELETLDDTLNDLTYQKELLHLSSLSNQLNSTYWQNEATLFTLQGYIRNDDLSQGYYDDAATYESNGIMFKDNAFFDINRAEDITKIISDFNQSKSNYYFWSKALILVQIISSIIYFSMYDKEPPQLS